MSWALGLWTAEEQEQNDKINVTSFMLALSTLGCLPSTHLLIPSVSCVQSCEAQNLYGPLEDSKHAKPEVR